MAISSRVICRHLSLPYVYDTRISWGEVLRWINRRGGRIEVLTLYAYPEKTPDASYAYVCPDDIPVMFFMCMRACVCVCVCVFVCVCSCVCVCVRAHVHVYCHVNMAYVSGSPV